jgi:uncharacterized protein involved in exopolysaccharide biosynthesis
MSDPEYTYRAQRTGGYQTPPPPFEEHHEELFDWAKIRRYVAFSLGSVKRRFWLFLAIWCGMIGLAVVAIIVLPKSYMVESRLLAQKNAVLTVRADSNQFEQPTKAAAETIMQTENLRDLLRQTNAIAEWPKTRAPINRLKDAVSGMLGSKATADQMLENLTGLLEKNFNIYTTPDGSIVIQLTWPDGVMAYRLVDAAEQNFIEKRRSLEVSTIAEQITIYEGYAEKLKADVERQVAELQKSRDKNAPRLPKVVVKLPPSKPFDPEIATLRAALESKRQEITELEEFRRRHLAELQTQLAEQSATYSQNHPVIVNLRQSIEDLKQDSPQLVTLRQEQAALRAQLTAHGDTVDVGGPSAAALANPSEIFRSMGMTDDAATEYARAQLRYTVEQYAQMRDRISAARIDLDTAKVAFKYRYSIVVPPEVPRGPTKPKPGLIIAAAVIVGFLLALFGTTASDLRGGRVIEVWQLENLLSGSAIVQVRLP